MFRLIIAFILISSPIFAEEICPREEGCPVKNGVCIGCIIEGSLEKIQWEHHSLMKLDNSRRFFRKHYPEYYGKPEWICLLTNHFGTVEFKIELTKIIYDNPLLLAICNKTFAHDNANKWPILKEKYLN